MTNLDPSTAAKLDSLLARRSIRAYEPRPVSPELVQAMLEAAMAAPSAVACDPWRFIVLGSAAVREQVAAGLPHGKMLGRAGVGFVVAGDPAAAHDQQLSYLLQDCSAAIENLLLAAHALGLGAVWLGVHPRESRIEHVRRVLGIPESILPVACIAVGYPAETRPARTRFRAEYVHRDRW